MGTIQNRLMLPLRSAEESKAFEQVARELAKAYVRADALKRDLNACLRDAQQFAVAILALKARRADDQPARDFLHTMRVTLCAIGSVYAEQDVAGRSDRVDLAGALGRTANEVATTYHRRGIGLRLVTTATPVELHRGQRLAVIAAELATNAFKHAFARRRFGSVEVGVKPVDHNRACMWVADNGAGPLGLSFSSSKLSGLRIAHVLADEVGSNIVLCQGPGTRLEMTFAMAE